MWLRTRNQLVEAIAHEIEALMLQKVIAMFDDGDPANLSNAVEVATDAWNYFPHKILDGLSPAEVLLKHKNK